MILGFYRYCVRKSKLFNHISLFCYFINFCKTLILIYFEYFFFVYLRLIYIYINQRSAQVQKNGFNYITNTSF